jgi:thymidylate kinase
MTRRIGIVGIDGSGKSTIMRRLRHAVASESLISLTCPDFHDTASAPLQSLSRQLRAFSDGADVVGHPAIKAAALYLQMTLYGPVERFCTETFRPAVLVCERHPIVESLVYGPVYVGLGRRGRPGVSDQDRIRKVLDGAEPAAMDSILAWYAREAARLGTDGDVWSVLDQVSDLVARGPAAAIDGFGLRYQTTLPDDIVWLDVAPEVAARRCAARAGGRPLEAHETVGGLTALRNSYLRARDVLAEHAPGLRFRTVTATDTVVDDLIRSCLNDSDESR